MRNKEFADLVQVFRQKQDELILRKGNDYTIQNEDRLHNFKFVADQLGISPLQALGVYWLKHVLAICTFIKLGKIESEDLEGRFLDEANYNLLGWALLNDIPGHRPASVREDTGASVEQVLSKMPRPEFNSVADGRKRF